MVNYYTNYMMNYVLDSIFEWTVMGRIIIFYSMRGLCPQLFNYFIVTSSKDSPVVENLDHN